MAVVCNCLIVWLTCLLYTCQIDTALAALKSPKDDSTILQLLTKQKVITACWNLQTRWVEALNHIDMAAHFETISLDPDVKLPNLNKAVISKMVGSEFLEQDKCQEWGLVVNICLPGLQDEWDIPNRAWFSLVLTWAAAAKGVQDAEAKPAGEEDEEEDHEELDAGSAPGGDASIVQGDDTSLIVAQWQHTVFCNGSMQLLNACSIDETDYQETPDAAASAKTKLALMLRGFCGSEHIKEAFDTFRPDVTCTVRCLRGLLALLSPIHGDCGSSLDDLKYIAAEGARNSQLIKDIPAYGRVIVTVVRRYWKHKCTQYIKEESTWAKQTGHVSQATSAIQQALDSFDHADADAVIKDIGVHAAKFKTHAKSCAGCLLQGYQEPLLGVLAKGNRVHHGSAWAEDVLCQFCGACD